ncbi:MAG: hypothetical protein KCHDKBKB_02887 [Elusimicrobia bacterium]|nr:hypothetical protein [Elusimicrobiota bacterium]
MELKGIKPKVKLTGEDGNAFAILGRVSKALRQAGQGDKVKEMTDKAMSGDYNHLLSTVMEYVEDIGEENETEADDEN